MLETYVEGVAQPVFRNPDLVPVIPYRDYLRENFPAGGKGFVVEDVDLLVRAYGAQFQTDATGKFMLLECKFGRAWPGFAQLKTFGLVDSLLQLADPQRQRYKGFYVLQYDNEDWSQAAFRLNGSPITRESLDRFLQFQLDLPSYVFPTGN